jgi:serine/threonine-protein phosphatase 2A activator
MVLHSNSGSGHELSFVIWLMCLDLLGCFTPSDYPALVNRVFFRYLCLVRRIQSVYNLEPAGSHGVWGLDDHQFLSYLWGSAQLYDHKKLSPKSSIDTEIIAHFSKDYMFLGCIEWIMKVKTGNFYETSPMLYDISSVPTWTKVNTGLLKMYIAEVLGKFPVVQHLKFGNLLPFIPVQQ